MSEEEVDFQNSNFENLNIPEKDLGIETQEMQFKNENRTVEITQAKKQMRMEKRKVELNL